MDRSNHTLACLFAQLGLDNKDTCINDFINKNKGIPADVHLANAGFWNPAQADFLTQAIVEDSDWAEIVDSLDNLLR
ncbi:MULTISPECIES: DUF2789 domain-containing protein [Thalassomonas]|uniref:DUF2789 domain-containing protein n=1 Tax=Thalassomonas actiniarum TaxID=485447 RepID=A0AAF0BZ08_9GAMM|nr:MULTISPECIES: DUF2789 domain-containing protein [Thalassomonas]WDD97701.1 DUF2789 domain-containing protein [Thalassomonas actiniarum]